jgi:ribose transport system substrate-binding protein
VAVIVAVALGPVACTSSTTATPAKPVAMVVANTELNFAKELIAGFQVGVAAETALRPVVVGPKIVDGDREVQLFNDVVDGSTGGVTLFTLSPELFVQPLAKAASRGVPLIAVDNPPMAGSDVTLFIGNNNTGLGRMLADQVIKKLPADTDGDIVLGTTAPGAPVLDRRVQGMLAEFALRLPKARVLGPFDTKQSTRANRAAWDILVKANPKARAFVGTGDADGWNLADIRRETGAHWVAGAFDLDPRSLKAVAAGELLLVSPEHYAAGVIAGRLQAARMATGKKLPEGWITIPGLAVTPENVAQVIERQESNTARVDWFAAETDEILDHLDEHLTPMSTLD